MGKTIENYYLGKVIGQGQFGKVHKGHHMVTNVDVAVKCMSRAKLTGKFIDLLNNEIKVLKCCNNNNIIKLYDIKKTSNNIYLITEFCNEGDLYETLKKKKVILKRNSLKMKQLSI
jgi:serine/threonine protein kinase